MERSSSGCVSTNGEVEIVECGVISGISGKVLLVAGIVLPIGSFCVPTIHGFKSPDVKPDRSSKSASLPFIFN